MHHVHESPPVMILPLVVLAAGAVFAGMIGFHYFVGEGREAFWRDSILVLPDHDSIEARASRAVLGVESAAGRRRSSASAVAWLAYICAAGAAGRSWPRRFRPLYLFLLNKWYFDELYDFLFVRPAMALGPVLWKSGDGTVIDGLRPRRHRRGDARPLGLGQPAADRLSLPLRLRHADRRRGAGLLVSAAGGGGLNHGALAAPVAHHLPAAFGRAGDHAAARRGRDVARTGALDRALDLARHFRALGRGLGGLRSQPRRFPARSNRPTGCPISTSPTTWASTASRCSSCCSRPS